nr:MAG: hypothetical protein ADFBMEEK_00091 [Peromyscus leucopus gammaherpesvirus]
MEVGPPPWLTSSSFEARTLYSFFWSLVRLTVVKGPTGNPPLLKVQDFFVFFCIFFFMGMIGPIEAKLY